jgi:hypothetical protein
MKRSILLSCCCGLILLATPTFTQTSSPAKPKSPAPRCVREACSAALRGYKGALLNQCRAYYARLSDNATEVWMVSIDAGSSKFTRTVNAKTGEIMPDADPASVTKCGPRPFHCPDWVYKPCPAE